MRSERSHRAPKNVGPPIGEKIRETLVRTPDLQVLDRNGSAARRPTRRETRNLGACARPVLRRVQGRVKASHCPNPTIHPICLAPPRKPINHGPMDPPRTIVLFFHDGIQLCRRPRWHCPAGSRGRLLPRNSLTEYLLPLARAGRPLASVVQQFAADMASFTQAYVYDRRFVGNFLLPSYQYMDYLYC